MKTIDEFQCPLCKGTDFIKHLCEGAEPGYVSTEHEFYGCTRCGIVVMDPEDIEG